MSVFNVQSITYFDMREFIQNVDNACAYILRIVIKPLQWTLWRDGKGIRACKSTRLLTIYIKHGSACELFMKSTPLNSLNGQCKCAADVCFKTAPVKTNGAQFPGDLCDSLREEIF